MKPASRAATAGSISAPPTSPVAYSATSSLLRLGKRRKATSTELPGPKRLAAHWLPHSRTLILRHRTRCALILSFSSCGGFRFLRIDSPRISMRWALWTKRSRIPQWWDLRFARASARPAVGEVRTVERVSGSDLRRSPRLRGARFHSAAQWPSHRSPEHQCGLATL
jgi:hypothetical protein